MSLTSFIAEKDVKTIFREVFPLPQIRLEPLPVAEPLTNHYTLIGTAFDYLLRFSLERLHAHTVGKPWIAELAAIGQYYSIAGMYGKARAEQSIRIVKEARQLHKQYLQTDLMLEELFSSVLLLAQIDPFFRARKLYEPFGVVDPLDIEDLKRLFAIIPFDRFSSQSVCLLDPTFGSSNLVGGADVDLILDETMIDIKTTKFLQVKREYIDQLLGYYILYRLGGITGMPEGHVIGYLGIYFSRHGYLYTFPVSQLAQETVFLDFLPWFEQRAKQLYGGDHSITNFM